MVRSPSPSPGGLYPMLKAAAGATPSGPYHTVPGLRPAPEPGQPVPLPGAPSGPYHTVPGLQPAPEPGYRPGPTPGQPPSASVTPLAAGGGMQTAYLLGLANHLRMLQALRSGQPLPPDLGMQGEYRPPGGRENRGGTLWGDNPPQATAPGWVSGLWGGQPPVVNVPGGLSALVAAAAGIHPVPGVRR